MAIKDQVQGVVLALFGAAAGSHLTDLTKQATDGSIKGLAGGLVGLQSLLTGVDYTKNADWIKDMLVNLGLKADTAAYTEATAWATAQLTAGASRADVVVAAVDYLLAPTGQSAAFTGLAKAFKGDVAAAVTWSEGATGSKVISYTALKAATPAVRDNVSEVFADYALSSKALVDAFAATTKTLGSTKVEVVAGKATTTIPADTNGDKAVSAAELTAYAATQTATTIAAAATTAKNNLTTATSVLEQARATVSTTEKGVGTTPVLLSDAVLTAAVAKTKADMDKAAATQITALELAKKTLAEAVVVNGTDGSLLSTLRGDILTLLGNAGTSATGAASGDAFASQTGGGNVTVSALLAILNAATSATSTTTVTIGGNTFSAKSWLETNSTKTFADFQALVLNHVADQVATVAAGFTGTAAAKSIAAIEARATLNLDVLAKQAALDTTATGADYKAALATLAAREQLIANVTALQAYSDTAAAAAKAYKDASAANTAVLDRFTALKYEAPVDLSANAVVNASQVKGVYINKLKAGEAATVSGMSNDDTFYLGNYTVQKLTTAEAAGWTSTTRVGDAAKLEVFVAASGTADTKIYVETSAVAGNGLDKGEISTITLVGITPDKVSLSEDGFLLIGGGI